MTDPATLIQWLLDNKVAKTFVHKGSQEQMVEITEFGIEVNAVLEKLKTTSEEAKQTNEILAESENKKYCKNCSKQIPIDGEFCNPECFRDFKNKKETKMSPEERCYIILQDSKYIRIPEEDPAQKIESFLDSAKGCSWE